MKTDYQNKSMSTEQETTKVVESTPVVVKFNFPADGITVEASNLEEAVKKLEAIKNNKK